jgi:hypothetical protein
MADVPDLEMQTYAAIRSILENDAAWSGAVDPANRIWHNGEPTPTSPEKASVADGDFPQSELRVRAGSSQLYESEVTLGTYAPGNPCNYLERGTLIFRLILFSQLLGQTEQSNLRNLTINALRKAGPRLGLNFISAMKTIWETTQVVERTPDDDTGMVRERIVININLSYEEDGSTLKGS